MRHQRSNPIASIDNRRPYATDVQYAFGLTYPTPGTFYTTGEQPPYVLDPMNDNEPYIEAGSGVFSQVCMHLNRPSDSGLDMSWP